MGSPKGKGTEAFGVPSAVPPFTVQRSSFHRLAFGARRSSNDEFLFSAVLRISVKFFF
jgi:hypothetical protein